MDQREETPIRRAVHELKRLGYDIDPVAPDALDEAEQVSAKFDASLYDSGPLSVDRLDPRRLAFLETIIAWLDGGGHDYRPVEVAYYRHRAAVRQREIAIATGKLYALELPAEASALPVDLIHCYMAEFAEEDLLDTAETLALATGITRSAVEAAAVGFITSRVDWEGMKREIDRRRSDCGLAPVHDLQAVRAERRTEPRSRRSRGSSGRRRGSRRSGGSGGGGSGDDDPGESEPARRRLLDFPREVAL
ncbi:MAG TPA: hypothetical protein VF009_07045 [Solirubrobacterales bacterium]